MRIEVQHGTRYDRYLSQSGNNRLDRQQGHKTQWVNHAQTMRFSPSSFTGKERDEETGYGYFGARYMDHELMTMWLSVDPMADKYPSISPYAYCAWNPVKLVDPDGREAIIETDWPPKRFKEKWNKLNRHEQDVIRYDIRFMKALDMEENSGLAVAETEKQYGRNGKGDESDAFRHAYWQALNTQDVGEDFTRKMSDAHEYSTPAKEVDLDLIMDIHNNDLGIQVGRENPQASPAELISIIKSKMDAGELLIIKDGKLVKSNGKPVAKSEIRRLSKSLEIKNDILLHSSTKVEGGRYE